MKKIIVNMLVLGLMLSTQSGWSQTVKSLYKDGKKAAKSENYTDAISLFSRSIAMDGEFLDAYLERADAYEKSGDLKLAAKDYEKAFSLDAKHFEHAYNAARNYFNLKDYGSALLFLNQAAAIEQKDLPLYQLKTKTELALQDYSNALADAKKALDIKKTAVNYYLVGLSQYYLNQFDIAEENLAKSVRENDQYREAYNALANTQINLGKLDDALININKSIALKAKDKEALLIRSSIYRKKAEYPLAINDLSTILSGISPDDESVYSLRAELYQEFNQHQNAINDYCKLISLNENNALAYYGRAKSYDEVSKDKEASQDYEKFVALFEAQTTNDRKLIQTAKQRIYILNKESNKPEIQIKAPVINETNYLMVPMNAEKIVVKGNVSDESALEYLTINDEKYVFPANGNDNSFEYEVPAKGTEKIVIAASDIYHNLQTLELPVQFTEVNPPVIHMLNPYASDNGEIYIETTEANVFVEGKITDESLIKSIEFEGVLASYNPTELNPSFTATVSIANKNALTIKVTDQFDNVTETKYTINREGAELLADNPMGKTWVIFIENSNYESFASLDGPAKDVKEMKAAMANYNISNFIHKKDMTKADMARFFSIELRDLVRENKVNSLLVWYAGHGKFIHETGYWIPVNASRDDEFTYFNINNLKAAMQSYSKYVTHTLVITDACESGPSFYMAMRSDIKERDCGDWQATKFKSSQVFTSAGNELAADKSAFTETFSNTLKYNPDDCIAIDNIVLKVTKAISEKGAQKPRFGKIAGLEDEDGTFFFIKK